MASEARKQAASEQLLDGRFVLGDVIGRGRQSIVYKAEQLNPPTPLQKIVALKLVFGSNKDKEGVLRRVRREALGMLASRSEHTIRLYDYVVDSEQPYLVMEYAERGDLKAYVTRKGGSLDFDEAVEITVQTLKGLAAVHRAGMIHRDMKAENVLVTGQRLVKLADFSIASVPTEYLTLEKANPVVGTFDYLAPESLNDGVSSVRSDLYSVGMTFYELVTGVYPFGDGPFSEQVQKKLAAAWTPLPEYLNPVPNHLPELFKMALASNPEERFATAEQFIEALEGVRIGIWQPPVKLTQQIKLPIQEGILAPENDEGFEDYHQGPDVEHRSLRGLLLSLLLLAALGVAAAGTYYAREKISLSSIQDKFQEFVSRIQRESEEKVSPGASTASPVAVETRTDSSESVLGSVSPPNPPVSLIVPTFSIRLAQYSGLPATVIVSLPDAQALSSPRLILQVEENRWSLPLKAEANGHDFMTSFPTPVGGFSVAVAADVEGRTLESAPLPVEIDCQSLNSSDGEGESNSSHPLLDRSLKLAAQVDYLSYSANIARFESTARELPSSPPPPAPPKSSGSHRFRCLMANPNSKLLALSSEQLQELMELRINKVDILEKQLAESKNENTLQGLNQRAEVARISDVGPLFSMGMSQTEFAYRLALLGAAEDTLRASGNDLAPATKVER